MIDYSVTVNADICLTQVRASTKKEAEGKVINALTALAKRKDFKMIKFTILKVTSKES